MYPGAGTFVLIRPTQTFYERIKFGPRVRGEERVVPCMLEYDNISIGYMQYYPVEKNHDSYWQVEAPR